LEANEVSINIELLGPILEDAAANGAAWAAAKHGVNKSYIQSFLSLARKLGAAPARKAGATRNYDPADVVAALAAKPLPEVVAQFGLSAATLLKIDADARKATKSGGSAAAGGEAVQAAA
jgi:hypothetical protein